MLDRVTVHDRACAKVKGKDCHCSHPVCATVRQLLTGDQKCNCVQPLES